MAAAYLLADPKKAGLTTAASDDGVTITLPATAPDRISSTVVVKVKGELKVEALGLAQAADGSLTLPAPEAVLHGSALRYESSKEHDNIGFWTNPDDWVEWQIKVTKPGKFEVSALIASMGTGAFQVVTGDQKLRGTGPNTGDYTKFQTVTLGTLELKSQGRTSIAVRPIKEGWSPINLRSIQLKPMP